jgi:hypothetical protein
MPKGATCSNIGNWRPELVSLSVNLGLVDIKYKNPDWPFLQQLFLVNKFFISQCIKRGEKPRVSRRLKQVQLLAQVIKEGEARRKLNIL